MIHAEIGRASRLRYRPFWYKRAARRRAVRLRGVPRLSLLSRPPVDDTGPGPGVGADAYLTWRFILHTNAGNGESCEPWAQFNRKRRARSFGAASCWPLPWRRPVLRSVTAGGAWGAVVHANQRQRTAESQPAPRRSQIRRSAGRPREAVTRKKASVRPAGTARNGSRRARYKRAGRPGTLRYV